MGTTTSAFQAPPAPHIDNGFFRVTREQARKLTRSGKLPREGYEARATTPDEILRIVTPVMRDGTPVTPADVGYSHWVKQTCVQGKGVWALHLHFLR